MKAWDSGKVKRTAREEAFFVQNLEAAGDGGKGKEMESGKKILVIQGGGPRKGQIPLSWWKVSSGGRMIFSGPSKQAVSYYRFTLVNYIGFHDKGMLLAGGCGDTNGSPRIGETGHLEEAYDFGKGLYG